MKKDLLLIETCRLMAMGYHSVQISQFLEVSQTTISSKRKKLRSMTKEEFSEFFHSDVVERVPNIYKGEQ